MTADSQILLGLFLLGLPAMSCLSLSMERHGRQVAASLNQPIQRALLRGAGFALIGVAMAVAVTDTGWGQGLVSLLGALSFSAVAVVGFLTYRPKWLISVAVFGLLGGVVIGL